MGEWNSGAGPDGMGGVVLGAAVRHAHDRRDAMGRVVERLEYADGITVSHSRLSEYSRAGLIQRETTRTFTDTPEPFTQYFTENVVTYDYRLGSGTGAAAYSGDWQGVVTRVRTTSTKVTYNGTRQTQPTSQTNYTHTWWDSALQARIAFDADVGDGTAAKTSTFAYDVNGRVSYVSIDDGRPRTVTFVTDSQGQVLTRREADRITATGDPFSQYVYFNGQRIGEITNDATFTQRSYSAAVIARTAPPSTTSSKPFQNGVSNNPIHGASFDYGYESLRPDSVQGSGQAWTVRDGDTLQGIAAAVWGDASLWYLIAEHNGLTGASMLTAGQLITVPARVANLHNTSETFRPYDPNKALGDLNPTQPAPPKKPGGCGVVGQVIAVVIAVAIVIATKGAATQIGATILQAVGISGTAAAVAAPVVGSAAIAAAASTASQAFLVATGAQDNIDWKQVAIATLTASPVGSTPASFVQAAAQTALRNVVVQGVAVATGLQHKFDWTGVAVSAVVGGVSHRVSGWTTSNGFGPDTVLGGAISGTASAFAGAATRSVVQGTSFGDNLMAALPDVIGSTIGNAVGRRIEAAASSRPDQIEVRTTLDGGGSGSVAWGMDDEGRRFIEGGMPAYGYQDEPKPDYLGEIVVTGRRLNWWDRLLRDGRDLVSGFIDYTGADRAGDRLMSYYTRGVVSQANAVSPVYETGKRIVVNHFTDLAQQNGQVVQEVRQSFREGQLQGTRDVDRSGRMLSSPERGAYQAYGKILVPARVVGGMLTDLGQGLYHLPGVTYDAVALSNPATLHQAIVDRPKYGSNPMRFIEPAARMTLEFQSGERTVEGEFRGYLRGAAERAGRGDALSKYSENPLQVISGSGQGGYEVIRPAAEVVAMFYGVGEIKAVGAGSKALNGLGAVNDVGRVAGAAERAGSSRLTQGLQFEADGTALARTEAFAQGGSTQRLSVRAFDDAGNLLPGRTVLDMAGTRLDNSAFGALEFKLTENAPYTARQLEHFPYLAKNGGVVVGTKGEAIGLPAGSRLPAFNPNRIDGPTLPGSNGWWP